MKPRAFVLFEAILAVAIFSLAVLGLGKCVDNCLRAQVLIQDEERARRALENRLVEIEARAVEVKDPKTEELKGMFAGMKLRQSRSALKWQNEKGEEIAGLYQINLEVTWDARGETQRREMSFYVQAPR